MKISKNVMRLLIPKNMSKLVNMKPANVNMVVTVTAFARLYQPT